MPAPLCAFGSEPKVGAPLSAWISYIDAHDWLGLAFPIYSWVASGLRATLVTVADFCATEPPQPVYPGDDVLRDASHDPDAFEEVLRYLREGTTWWAWTQLCQCIGDPDGVDPTTCETLLGHPRTFSSGSGDCDGYSFGIQFVPSSAVTVYGGFIRVNTVGATTVRHGIIGSTDSLSDYSELVVPTTSDEAYYFATPVTLQSGHTYRYYVQFDGPGWEIPWDTFNSTPATNSWCTYTLAAYKNTPTGAWDVFPTHTVPVDPIICPGTGPTPPPGPPLPDTDAPPYPTPIGEDCAEVLCDLVRQLQIQLDGIRGQVDLIQRQNVPFAYLTETVHTGLSGSGSFSVHGMMGLLIQTSTVPAFWGSSSDTPPRFIPSPLAVTVGDAAGDQDHHFCHLVEELWFPPNMGAMTTVSYKFKPGCSGAITELRREF